MAITPKSNSPSSDPQPSANQPRRIWTLQRILMLFGGGLVALLVLLFLVGFFWLSRDPQGAGNFIRTLRDLLLIALALHGILITLALVILTLQVANLVNLLQTEIKPLLINLQETLNTAKGSAQFVGENLAAPFIKSRAFLAGAAVFVRDFGGLRRAIRRPNGTASNAAAAPDPMEMPQ
jgi:hypothetical protein